jgi:hypothetical protein
MKEDFISSLWKNCLLYPENLKTTDGDAVDILNPGQPNTDSGPDFFAAKLRINNTIWVGNVEVHVLASDWEKHRHHMDGAYDNIILHLVYTCDKIVYNSKGKMMPTLEVKNQFNKGLYEKYSRLKFSTSWIACQNYITHVDDLIIGNWLNRLLIERLERKTNEVMQFYHYFSSHWEDTCYFLIARNFGFKVNSTPFGIMIQNTPRTILLKNIDNLEVLEAILFGQAGMLDTSYNDNYPKRLQKEFQHQKLKHNLEPISSDLWKFARMRPVNFPTIRIAQFAMVLHKTGNLFRKIVESKNIEALNNIFGVTASNYWNDHYRFDHHSAYCEKKVGISSLYNLIINSVVPIMFVYGKETMNNSISEKAIQLLHELPSEDNQVIKKWEILGLIPKNAADTQALLELKKYYCISKKCLGCAIGHNIIFR